MKEIRFVCLALVTFGCGDDGSGTATAGGTTSGPSSGITMTATTPDVTTTTATAPTEADGSADASATGTATNTTGPVVTDTSASGPTSDPTSQTDTEPSTQSASETGSSTDATTTNPITNSSSTTEPIPATCGDGVVEGNEECDEGPDNGPMGACYADCTANVCGDGVQAPLEECDLGVENGPDSGCSTDCVILASACGNQSAMAELVPLPVDIIVAIDNSGSMEAEIASVQNNINVNFAQILESSGLDYRVILVSKYGALSGENVCIEAPLGGIPQGGCANPPAMAVNNPGKFYHYSRLVSSRDSWCRLLDTIDGAVDDDFDFAQNGWVTWLRPESFKTFIELTDDRVSCTYGGHTYEDNNNANTAVTEATEFDTVLRMLHPEHFGATPETRNYRWYSILGLPYNNPPEAPYGPMDPILIGKCPEGVNGGPGYQALSNMTGGLRFPLCNTNSYDVVFQAIADGVIDSAKLACEFDVPEAPPGKVLDVDSVEVLFTPVGQNPVMFTKVDDPAQCNAMSFYIMGSKVILCPDACTAIQGNNDATLEVEFTCEPLKPN